METKPITIENFNEVANAVITEIKTSIRNGEFKDFYRNQVINGSTDSLTKLDNWFRVYDELDKLRRGGNEGVFVDIFRKSQVVQTQILRITDQLHPYDTKNTNTDRASHSINTFDRIKKTGVVKWTKKITDSISPIIKSVGGRNLE